MNTIKIRIILKDKRPLVMSSREKLQKLNKHQNRPACKKIIIFPDFQNVK